uniref:IST1 homolog n=1 Tax=Globodera rostochiensis TaxID=31243 RepID=A0A914HQ50_GLORO
MSVSWGTQYSKLKTNLRLASNRLKLLQKKKTEQAVKGRCEIADFLSSDKEDRARIRVETIIREDFVVEAYELLEMYCELLLARFGVIQQMKDLDDGIAEAVSSLLWVAPRIGHEIGEFKVINDELTHKYGKQFAEAARMNQLPEPSRVSSKLVQKLSVSAPSKLLVEKYLITIAQSAGIDFVPDAKVMREDDDEIARAERNLINFMNEEQYGWTVRPNDANSGGAGAGGGKGGGGGSGVGIAADLLNSSSTPMTDGIGKSAPMPPTFLPNSAPSPPPEYAPPPPGHGGVYQQQQQQPTAGQQNNYGAGGGMYPMAHPPPPAASPSPYPNAAMHQHHQQQQQQQQQHMAQHFPSPILPTSEQHIYEMPQERDNDFLLPKLPDPPSDVPTTMTTTAFASGPKPPGQQHNIVDDNPNQDLDFDALAKRFDELKKRL